MNYNFRNNQDDSNRYLNYNNYHKISEYQRYPSYNSMSSNSHNYSQHQNIGDYGSEPFVVNIERASEENNYFRQTIWTGEYLQITLMSIDTNSDIGYEVHPHLDQFIRIEEGEGIVLMGDSMDQLDFQVPVYEDYAFVIPAGKWHNLINTGNKPIKLYSIYAPPQHPRGTIHLTKEEAMDEEEHH